MNDNTVKLLKECNAGCKSATNSMEQVLPFVKDDHPLHDILMRYNDEHIAIGDECHALLNKVHEDEKDPHPAAKVFSWISTEMKLMMDDQPEHVAELLSDGCHMGIKTVCKYKGDFPTASEAAKSLADGLVAVEDEMARSLRPYL